MKYLYISFFFLFLECRDPQTSFKKKEIQQAEDISLVKNHQIFVLVKNSFVDSLVQSVSELKELKISIEDLAKLNPNGIESFLDETLIKCDNLLNLKNNNFISRPEIKGRLKVLKTNVLKCKLNNYQNDIINLNESLKNLFSSYNILFERLESLGKID